MVVAVAAGVVLMVDFHGHAGGAAALAGVVVAGEDSSASAGVDVTAVAP